MTPESATLYNPDTLSSIDIWDIDSNGGFRPETDKIDPISNISFKPNSGTPLIPNITSAKDPLSDIGDINNSVDESGHNNLSTYALIGGVIGTGVGFAGMNREVPSGVSVNALNKITRNHLAEQPLLSIDINKVAVPSGEVYNTITGFNIGHLREDMENYKNLHNFPTLDDAYNAALKAYIDRIPSTLENPTQESIAQTQLRLIECFMELNQNFYSEGSFDPRYKNLIQTIANQAKSQIGKPATVWMLFGNTPYIDTENILNASNIYNIAQQNLAS